MVKQGTRLIYVCARHGVQLPLVIVVMISCLQVMSWPVTRGCNGVSIGKFSNHGAFVDGPTKNIIGLLPRRVSKDHPVCENPQHP